MKFIHLALILGWLYTINMAAGALLAKRMPIFGLAKATTLATATLAFFFIEHFYGFGNLKIAFPMLFIGAVIVLIKNRKELPKWAWSDHAFLIGFGYAFIWRYTVPDINTSTENITDLFFIANYVPGKTLPADNLWMPPYKFDFYYAFQHYVAALLSRILSVGPGYAYNMAYALIFGYGAGIVWETTMYHTRSRTYSYVVLIGMLIGATGISPLIEFIRTPQFIDQPLIAAMRFIGASELNTSLAPLFASPGREVQNYPLESFGYTLFIGDYHPPLSSFLVLCMYASALLLWMRDRQKTIYVYIMSLALPLTLICNAWVFPLLVIAYVGWIVYCYQMGIAIPWRAIIVSVVGGFFLAYPFLSYFAQQSLGASIKMTPAAQYSPLVLVLLQHWPAILMVALLALNKEYRAFSLYILVAYVVMMLVSEILYVEDNLSGSSNRTNTGMKWLGWIYLFGYLMAAWLAYSTKVAWQRVALYALIIIPTFAQGAYMAKHYSKIMGNAHRGQLEGHAWLTDNRSVADMLDYLKAAPDGIVLEYNAKGQYTQGSALSMFAVKPVFLGWSTHLFTWGKSWDLVGPRKAQMDQFYGGDLPDMNEWLLRNDIRYVVWSPRETDTIAFNRIQKNISKDYYWKSFNGNNTAAPVGIWVKK